MGVATTPPIDGKVGRRRRKGEVDWDTYAYTPGKIKNGDTAMWQMTTTGGKQTFA
jgi:hypothetical protein